MIAAFIYSSPDSTEILNSIAKDILPKGVYVTPDPISTWVEKVDDTHVRINPSWVVRNKDGMTIREETDSHTIALTDTAPWYVGLYSRYIVSQNPLLQLMSVTKDTYNSTSFDEQRPHFVIFAEITTNAETIDTSVMTIPEGSVFALLKDLDTTSGSSVVRIVTNTSSFPFDPQINSETGASEVVYVTSENAFYIYNALTSTWVRVDDPLVGSTTFTPETGTTVVYPAAVLLALQSGNQLYIQVTPSSPTDGHLGEYWIVKGPASFTVYNTGYILGATFDWSISIRSIPI